MEGRYCVIIFVLIVDHQIYLKYHIFMQSSKSESHDVIRNVHDVTKMGDVTKNNHLKTTSTEESKSKFGIQTQVIYSNGNIYNNGNIYHTKIVN